MIGGTDWLLEARRAVAADRQKSVGDCAFNRENSIGAPQQIPSCLSLRWLLQPR